MANEEHGSVAGIATVMPLPAVAQRQPPVAAAGSPVERVALGPVAGLLFLSGMCGLIFQVSWFREFRLLFGASTAASSAVLAVFMGGLGIGNAVLGKRADRRRSPLALYALFELSIALAAAVSPLLIDLLHGLYISSGRAACAGLSGGHRRAAGDFGAGAGHGHVSDGRDVAGGGPCGDGLRGSPAPRGRAALRREHAGSGGGSAGQHVLRPGVLRHAENALAGMSAEHLHRTVRVGASRYAFAAARGRRGRPAAADSTAHSRITGRRTVRPATARERPRRLHCSAARHVPGPHRLCRGRHRRLRVLPHGTRLVPHARADSRRDHLHFRLDTWPWP